MSIRTVLGMIVIILLLVNVFLFTQLTYYFIQTKRLHAKELRIVSRTFPPLFKEEIQSHIAELFPDFTLLKTQIHEGRERYLVYQDQILLGYAYEVKEDIPCPVCNDVRFFIGINKEDKIASISLINEIEVYGEKLGEQKKRKFLNQFLSGYVKPPYEFGENVNHITGATKSSTYFVKGINEVLSFHRNFKDSLNCNFEKN